MPARHSAPRAEPRASVLLPCFNAGETLAAALDSLLAQTMPHFEVLAVDDGSTDHTWELLAACAGRDARIRPLRHERNGGIVAALHTAIRHARAPLLARMDADDLCLPGRLEAQCALLDAEPGLDLVSGLVRFGGDRAACAGYARHVDWINTLLSPEDMARNRFVESPLAHPSVVFRRAAWERLGGYRAGDFPEDYELWLRWLDQGARMAKAREEVLVWNDPPTRLSRTAAEYSLDAFARVKAGYLWRWLQAHNPRHPEVRVWGAGRVSRRRLDPLRALGLRVCAYVDIDPRKIGQRIDQHIGGAPVIPREALPAPGPDQPLLLVNVASHGAREQIAQWLEARGYVFGVDVLAVG